MSETQLWDDVDDYFIGQLAPEDEVLTAALRDSEAAGLPEIAVSAAEGKLLHLLAQIQGATRVLEIGTLGGYSGIHLALALPADGKLITLELDPHHAEVAQRNFDRAGVGHKVKILVGPAANSLQKLAADGEAPFDLIFIDADKDGYTEYLRLSLPLLRDGGLLLGDNTLPDAVLNDGTSGTKRYNAAVAEQAGLTTTIIPILRRRGIDGLTVSVKTRL